MLRSGDFTQSESTGAVQAGRTSGLVALTNDALLTRALQELATNGVNVSVVPDMRSLTDVLLQNAGDTVLIDTAALEAPVTEVVDMVSSQLPDLCLMVAGHSTDQQLLTSRLTNKTVFRFVHKPASPQRLKLILDAAARPIQTARTTPTATTSVNRTLTRPATTGGSGIPRPALIGAGVLAALAIATWTFWPDASAPPAATAPAATQPAVAMTRVVTLVSQADAAFAAGKFVASDGSSAAEMYRTLLKVDASNRHAREGFDKSIDQALHRAEESLLAGKLNEAGTLVAAIALISPNNPRLEFLNTQIAREQARINSDTSQRKVFESQQASIRASLATMKERVQRGTLIDPAAASAVASFREAEAMGANDNAVRAARETLVAALLTAADTELSARRPPAAKRLVDAARSINSSAPGIDVLYRRVDEVATQLANPEPAPAPPRIETPAPAVVSAPVAAPAPAPAASPPAAAPAAATTNANTVVSASTLKIVRKAEPVYPEWALQQLISGWVEMEFTVAVDGSVKDIKIISAEPRTTFNNAATSALARRRYEPILRNGVAVAQRASIRMRFVAQDSK
jgi:TonB family protein